MVSKLKISKNILFKIVAAFLIICYWGFVDSVVFMRITQICFVAICMLKPLLWDGGKIKKNGYLKWAVVWFALSLASMLWSVSFDNTFSYLISVFQVLFVGVLIVNTVDSYENVVFLEKCIIVAGIILSSRLILTTPASSWGQDRLGIEIGMHVNTMSMNILISELLALKMFFINESTKCKTRWLYLLTSLFFIIIIFLTASKKNVIIMLMGPLLMLAFNGKKLGNKVKYAVRIVIVVLLLIQIIEYLPFDFGFAMQRIMSAYESYISGNLDASTLERQYLMKTAFETFSDHFLIGVGLNCSKCFNSLNLYAHCNYLEILADLGIIGFVVYYYLYICMGLMCLKRNTKELILRYNAVILVCLCVLEITQVTYYYESYQVFLAILWCDIMKIGHWNQENLE